MKYATKLQRKKVYEKVLSHVKNAKKVIAWRFVSLFRI